MRLRTLIVLVASVYTVCHCQQTNGESKCNFNGFVLVFPHEHGFDVFKSLVCLNVVLQTLSEREKGIVVLDHCDTFG